MAANDSTFNVLCLTDDAFQRRFWAKVDRRSHSECWPWKGCFNSKGYGRMRVRHLYLRAPRLSWIITFDRPIPDNHVVMHRCDNPACVNPSHLAIGTARDNTRDAWLRGRFQGRVERTRGERNYRARLTADDIRAIRNSGDTSATLAAHYGINRGTVNKIKRGALWRHVT